VVFSRIIRKISLGIDNLIYHCRWLPYLASIMIIIILVINVVGRFIFNKPLLGTVEIIEMGMVIVGFIAIPFASYKRSHVRVDFLVSYFPQKARLILSVIGFFLSFGITGIITYQSIILAIKYVHTLGQATPLLNIPYAPFRIFMAFGLLITCVKFLIDTLDISQLKDKD